MLTPWPFYLASMVLSLLLMVWGRYALPAMALLEPVHRWAYFTVVHNRWYFPGDTIVASNAAATTTAAAVSGLQRLGASDEESARVAAWQRIRSFAKYLPLLVNTVRSLAVMALAAQVYIRNGGDVRRPALSNVAAFLISVAPYIFRPKLFTAASTLAGAGAMLLAISAGIFTYARMGRPERSYGDLTAVGGSCPLNVPHMNASLPLVGCGLEALSAADKQRLGQPCFHLKGELESSVAVRHFSGGPVTRGEFWLGGAFTLYFAPLSLFFDVVAVVRGLGRCGWRLCCLLARGHRNSGNNRNGRRNNSRRNSAPNLASACSTMALIIAVYTTVMLPIHVAQQTRPKAFRVYDGFGPAVQRDSAAALNGVSWSDWFLVQRPNDSLGFLGAWWHEHGKRWDTLLAFV